MSDLQCPATLVLLTHVSRPGVRRAEHAERLLRDLRVAAVYAAPGTGPTADVVGEALSLPPHEEPGLDGPSYRDALAALADLHRGETVVVVAGEATIADLERFLGDPGEGGYAGSAPIGPFVVAIDSDGWVRQRLDHPTG